MTLVLYCLPPDGVHFPTDERWGMQEGSDHLIKNKNGLHDLSTFLGIVLYVYLNAENVD